MRPFVENFPFFSIFLAILRDSDCIFLADFSNFCKFSSLLSIITYWL